MKRNQSFPVITYLKRTIFILLIIQFTTPVAFGQYREIYNGGTEYNDINGMSFFKPSTGFVAFSSSIGFTTDSGRTFTQHKPEFGNTDYNGYSVNLTFGFYAQGVTAFSADSLFAYGHFGFEPSILFSADGGLHWKVVYHRPLNVSAGIIGEGITDLNFPGNGSTGFAVHNEEMLITTDRGQTWTIIVSVPGGEMKKLSFPTPVTGFAIGGNKLFATANGGATWNALNLPGNAGSNFNNVSFPSLKAGYISDYENGIIYKTVNEGLTWQKMNDETLQAVKGTDMYFTNDTTGYITADYQEYVYKTTNSAAVWEPCKKNTSYQNLAYGMNSLYFYNEKIGWAGGDNEYLMITTDGASATFPVALFSIDTTGFAATNMVNLVNHSRTTYQYRWFKNDTLISTDYNASFSHYYFQQRDKIQLVVINGADTDTATEYQSYEVQPLPSITGFTPATAAQGSFVTITGTNMLNTVSVSFGGVPADSFTIFNDYTIWAYVGKGATGAVSVASVHGATSLDGFTFLQPPTAKPPVVTSFSPLSGPAGTSVTITGTNFNASPAGNVVYFGIVRATVTAASATKITCKVPLSATYQDISVCNTTTHLSGYSGQPFNITFADSSHNFTTHSFAASYLSPYSSTHTGEYSATPFDVDGDGKPDIVSSENIVGSGNGVVVYKNISTKDTIAFADDVNQFSIPPAQNGFVKMADMDGDGKYDFVAATNDNYITVARNTSTLTAISSDTAVNFRTGPGSQQLAIDDLDGDGRPDLAVACYNIGQLSVLRNTSTAGHLSFTANKDYTTGSDPLHTLAVATGDLDGDGKKDIVTLNVNLDVFAAATTFNFFKNTSVAGALSFAEKQDFITNDIGLDAQSIIIADIDGDDRQDVIVLNAASYTVYRNTTQNSILSFAPPAIFGSFNYARGAQVDNLDGDSKPDYMANIEIGYGSSLGLYKNTSVPDSISYNPIVTGGGGYSIFGADFNGDGKQDILATGGTQANRISVYKNNIGIPIIYSVCSASYLSLEADVTGSKYQWQWDAGSGFVNIADDTHFSDATSVQLYISKPLAAWNGYRYRCVADGNISTTFILNVKPSPVPAVTITASDTAICAGAGVTFTAKSTNVYATEFYTWLVNGKTVLSGQGYNTYSGDVKDSDQVTAILSTDDSCYNLLEDTSNIITIKVTGAYPSVTVTPSDYSFCAGSEITYTAAVTGTTPDATYQWQVNGVNTGTDSSVFKTASLQDGDLVQVKVTSGATNCGTGGDTYSTPIYAFVTTAKPLSVSITASDSSVCSGTGVTFTANPVNTNSYASYQWQVNGISQGNGSNMFTTSLLQNNDQVKVVLTNTNIHCLLDSVAESNIISMKVADIIAKAGSDKTICQNNKVTIGSDDVPGYTYVWSSVPAGFTSAISSPEVSPAASTSYIVTASNDNCSASDTVMITVAPSFSVTGLPASPVSACPNTPVSIGFPLQDGFSYSWQSDPVGFTSDVSNPSVSPLVSTIYTLTQTNTATGCQAEGQVTFIPADCITETHIYPNPSSDYIMVETTIADLRNVVFELYDATGKSMTVQKLADSKKIIISAFIAGIYKFVIRQDGTIKSKGTVLIQRR